MLGRGRILTIDDCQINLGIYQKILRANYEVETALDGAAGLRKIDAFCPQLVLLDIMMPGLDGYEICRRIKGNAAGQFIQVILVSAKNTMSDRLKGYEFLADDYLVKPFNHDELLSKVRVQIRLWEAHRDLATAKRQLQLHNENLELKVLQRTQQIMAARDVTVFALAQLAESRDNETGDHLKRIRYYSRILAEELHRRGSFGQQIDAQFIDEIYRASPLHDVGKVGIPDQILLKPGKLTADEFNVIKRHVQIGGETLRQARDRAGGAFLNMAVDIAFYHHERYNGQGYLAGLKGDAIPLSARIVALADVYDALSSTRVYKPAFEPQKVYEMIVAESGEHFDPRIVEAFQARHHDFLSVRQKRANADDGPDLDLADADQDTRTPHESALLGDDFDIERGAIQTILSLNSHLRDELASMQQRLEQQANDARAQTIETPTGAPTQPPNRRACDEPLIQHCNKR